MKSRRGRALRKRYAHAKSAVKVENLQVVQMDDDNPDLSFLTGGGDPEYAEEDRKRYEAYQRGAWNMTGLWVEADVIIEGTVQKIRSGGLWGIESDAGKYFKTVAKDEYDELKKILQSMGAKKIPPLKDAEWVTR